MTSVAEAVAGAATAFEPVSDEARTDATLLLAHILGRDREWLFAHDDAQLTAKQLADYERLCERRAGGYPLAYLTGTAWFYGREFVVNEHVLIPRPESEHLVDEAVEFLRAHPKAHSVVDVGVGSGAVACSIAAEVVAAHLDGTDISSDAVQVATVNAQHLDVHARCSFVVGDLVSPLGERRFDVVVAKLPYIPSAEVPARPDPVGFEPREALDGGPDGLTYYRRFLQGAPRLLGPGGLLLLEAAPPVMDALHVLVNDAFPLADVSVRNDYGGRARYVRVRT